MGKPSASWKAFEAKICKLYGGKRRGADYADHDGGKNDCTGTPGFSIEIKYQKRPFFQMMLDDALKARERAIKGEIPIAIMKKKGSGSVLDTTLVVMTLRDHLDWHGPALTEESEDSHELESS